ncbi:MAG: hypothetical protein GJ680_08545 [Alteromonadaceae bacterium]|nr:hypothetical protein [Alteromonadaceae bacterium]
MQQADHNLPAATKKWIVENLLRGVKGLDLLKNLLNQGFTFEASIKALAGNLPQGVAYKYDESFYQQIALPKFLDKPGVTDHSNEHIQLYTVDDFVSPEECGMIWEHASGNLERSTTAAGIISHRTSRTCHLSFLNEPALKTIEQRIIDFMALAQGNKEVMQAQHYSVGEEFKEHTDFFTPGNKEYKEHCLKRGQRTWTFMLYLNDACTGGQTRFTKMDKEFSPKLGRALIWNNLYPNGMPNPNTEHQSIPVETGEKFIITKWFRTLNYG